MCVCVCVVCVAITFSWHKLVRVEAVTNAEQHRIIFIIIITIIVRHKLVQVEEVIKV